MIYVLLSGKSWVAEGNGGGDWIDKDDNNEDNECKKRHSHGEFYHWMLFSHGDYVSFILNGHI